VAPTSLPPVPATLPPGKVFEACTRLRRTRAQLRRWLTPPPGGCQHQRPQGQLLLAEGGHAFLPGGTQPRLPALQCTRL